MEYIQEKQVLETDAYKSHNKQPLLTKNVDKWHLRFSELMAYKECHGNCNVPQKYDDKPQLGCWIANQRKRRNQFLKGKYSWGLSEERMKLLESIGLFPVSTTSPTAIESKTPTPSTSPTACIHCQFVSTPVVLDHYSFEPFNGCVQCHQVAIQSKKILDKKC